jgi:hypothetical protein
VKVDMLNMDGGLSLEPARVRDEGGGGKLVFEAGSGDDLYKFGDIRAAGDDTTSSLGETTGAR